MGGWEGGGEGGGESRSWWRSERHHARKTRFRSRFEWSLLVHHGRCQQHERRVREHISCKGALSSQHVAGTRASLSPTHWRTHRPLSGRSTAPAPVAAPTTRPAEERTATTYVVVEDLAPLRVDDGRLALRQQAGALRRHQLRGVPAPPGVTGRRHGSQQQGRPGNDSAGDALKDGEQHDSSMM